MSNKRTGREHTQRDKGRSPRAKVERQVETHILSSSDTRVRKGERAKLQLMSDGTLRLLLLEQMGMARTHGRAVRLTADDGTGARFVDDERDGYILPSPVWQELNQESPCYCWAVQVAPCETCKAVAGGWR